MSETLLQYYKYATFDDFDKFNGSWRNDFAG